MFEGGPQRFGPFSFGGTPPPSRAGAGWFLFLPGALFAGLGMAILLVPDLFRLLVAVLFLAVGAVLLLAALQLRRARKQQRKGGITAFFRSGDPDA